RVVMRRCTSGTTRMVEPDDAQCGKTVQRSLRISAMEQSPTSIPECQQDNDRRGVEADYPISARTAADFRLFYCLSDCMFCFCIFAHLFQYDPSSQPLVDNRTDRLFQIIAFRN